MKKEMEDGKYIIGTEQRKAGVYISMITMISVLNVIIMITTLD
jgi:hypothetical protein